ncbi:MAG: type VI secretion system baseplate subunit TssG [bacterium]
MTARCRAWSGCCTTTSASRLRHPVPGAPDLPEPEARTALTTTLGHNALGVTAIAGRRVWDAQAGFRLDIGPLDWEVFVDFPPIGRRWDALLKLVRYYTRNAFSFNFRLAVDPGQVHRCRPGLSTAPGGPRLGWTSWLTTAPCAARRPGPAPW